TDERQIYPRHFPNLYSDLYVSGVLPPYFPIEAYDPTLTRVVYPYLKIDQSGQETSEGFRLWDIIGRRTLVDLPALASMTGLVCSDEGSFFAVVALPDFPNGYPELFRVSRNGSIRQLTDLEAFGGDISSNSYSWSHDGRYLAFWLHGSRSVPASPE